MNTKYKFLKAVLSLIFLSFFISCSSSNEEASSEKVGSSISDEFISYDLKPGIDTKHLSEMISSIEFTRLEETDESLLSYANNYKVDNGQVVFSSGSDGDVYVFTETGELKGKFNRKGEGPEEYTGIMDLWLEGGDTVAIYVRGKFIKRYDLEGNFFNSEDVNISAGHVIPYADGYALDTHYATLKDSLFYDFTVVDSEFNIKEMYLPNSTADGIRVFVSVPSVSTYKNGIIYSGLMRDTVYYYNNEGFRPMIHFDLGSDWFFQEEVEFNGNMFSQMQSSGKIWNIVTNLGESVIYVSSFGGEKGKNKYLIDRATGKVIRLSVLKRDPEETFGFNTSFWENGILNGTMQSLDVGELVAELQENQYSFNEGSTLEEIESSENPVLVKVKFKESSEW